MPLEILKAAVSEFETNLDELASNAKFVRAAIRLRPRLGTLLNWEAADAKEYGREFIASKDAEEALLIRGLVVLLAGVYEDFIRRLLRDSVSALNVGVSNYSTVAERIRKNNMYWTGTALQTIHEPKEHLDLDFENLAKNLGTCFTGSPQFTLNAQAFSVFISILSPNNLEKALERIDINLNWDQLTRTRPVQEALERKDTRDATKALQEFLVDFSKKRNRIAHAGGGSVVMLESDFSTALKIFRIFARSLAAVVELEVKKMIEQGRE